MATISEYQTSKGERRWRVRYRKPDNSQTDKRGFLNKKAAQEWAARLQVNLADGEWVDGSKGKALLGPLAETWYESFIDIRPTTLAGYRQSLNKHILPTWGNRALGSIAFGEVQSWVNGLYKSLSASSTRQIFFNLRSILDFAIQDKKLKRNVCANVRLPKLPSTKRPYLSNERVIDLAEASGDGRDVILTLAYTGLRFGELVALRVRSIDFTNNYLDINQSISEVGGQLVEGPPKNGEFRKVPFPDFLKPILSELTLGKNNDDYVFNSPKGGVLRIGNFRRDKFNPAVKLVQHKDPEFPKVTPHDLRHTTASLAVSAGANIKSLQRMLGHAKASITLDTYAELFEEDLSAVSVALNNIAGPSIVGKKWAKTSGSEFEAST